MIGLTVVLIVVTAMLTTSLYLLGFRLGRGPGLEELARIRSDAIRAEQRLHELTRQAFVSMTEAADRQRRSDRS